MKETNKQHVIGIKEKFVKSKKTFIALGDETRQHLLNIMVNSDCNGWRVIDIAKKTNLSRPAVSHHMQIFKDCGIVKSRKEGRNIYYYLDPEVSELDNIISLLEDIKYIVQKAPNRKGE